MTLISKCRVCLNGDRLMYAMSNTIIQETWEKMTNAIFNSNDGKPVLACYICCAQLRKCHQMMKRALKAEELLTKCIHNGVETSKGIISLVASLTNDLEYNYALKPIHCLELTQFNAKSVDDIKVEKIDEDVEDNEAEKRLYFEVINREDHEVTYREIDDNLIIKKDKEDYIESFQEESLELGDAESEKYSNDENIENILERVFEKEAQIVLERIDADSLTSNHKTEYIPYEAKRYNPIEEERDKSKKFISRIKCDDSENVSTQCVRSPDLTSLNTEINKLDSVSVKKPLIRKFSCEICGSKHLTNYNLNMHLRKHTGEQPYACNLCDHKFTQHSNLTRHMLSHTKDKELSCPLCLSKFFRNDHLIRHLRTHAEDKKFRCDKCVRTFTRKDHLNKHLRTRIHSLEKKYICDICHFGYAVKYNLIKHIRSVHINNEKNATLYMTTK